jgi:uncharacterized protein
MTSATRPTTVAPAPPSGATGRPAAPVLVAVVQGVAFVVLVAADGIPPWRALRAVVVVAGTVAATAGLRRASRSVRGWTAVGWGLAGLVTGLGIAPAHLSKSGATTGAALLFAGLALAAYGTVVLVRAARGWHKLLAVPAAALVAQFVLLPVPQSIAATNVPPTSSGAPTPAAAGLTYEDVVVHTRDGIPLVAWFVSGPNRAAVVLLHGAGSTRGAVVDHAAVLARHGYCVLLLDTRGHGASAGRAMDFGWYGVPDVAAAVSHLVGRSDVDADRIAVVGLSMGGEQAITAAAADRRIRAVVAEGVERRSTGDLETLPSGVGGAVQRAVEWTVFTVADLLTEAAQPIGLADAFARTAPRPILLIAGRGGVDGARQYRAAAPVSTQLWELPDTPHTQGLARHPDQWSARVTAFLDSALRP